MQLSLVILILTIIFNNDVDAIINGSRVDIDSASYMVMIRDYNDGDSLRGHICGGVLITRLYVLSAAHCFSAGDFMPLNAKRLDSYVVVAGESSYSYNAMIYEIAEIYIHPLFRGDYFNLSIPRADMAILKLATKVPKSIQPIELRRHLPDLMASGLVYGWGKTSFKREDFSHTLQGIVVKYYDLKACIWDSPFSVFTQDELCVYSLHNNSDICQGDHGGPFVVNDKLVGIISHGSNICDSSKPIALSSVIFHHSFIKSVLQETVKPDYPPRYEQTTPSVPYSCPSVLQPQKPRRRFIPRRRRRLFPKNENNNIL